MAMSQILPSFMATAAIWIISCVFFGSATSAATSASPSVVLFNRYKEWTGYFYHNLNSFQTTLTIYSVSPEGIFAGLKSEHLNVDFEGIPTSNLSVVFRETSKWQHSPVYQGHTNLVIKGAFTLGGDTYRFEGNASSTEQKNFGLLIMQPKASGQNSKSKNNEILLHALAIGIPVVMAIVIIMASVAILLWAIRKGYLRHVPMAYKRFLDPKSREMELKEENADSGQGQTVHM